MTDLVIIGAGGFSRNIVELVEDLNRVRAQWNLCGFLDDNPELRGKSVMGYAVLGGLDWVCSRPSTQFVIGVANHRNRAARQTIRDRLGLPAERYATLIDPSANVSCRATVGPGTVLLRNVVVSFEAGLGSHVLVSPGCLISHGSLVEDYVTFAASVTLNGNCRVGRGAYLGAGCVIRDNVEIGQDAMVGMGAVVVKNVLPATTVFGCPARVRP